MRSSSLRGSYNLPHKRTSEKREAPKKSASFGKEVSFGGIGRDSERSSIGGGSSQLSVSQEASRGTISSALARVTSVKNKISEMVSPKEDGTETSGLDKGLLRKRTSLRFGPSSSEQTEQVPPEISFESPRAFFSSVVFHQGFEMFTGFVILMNFLVIVMETDARSKFEFARESSAEKDEAMSTLQVLDTVNRVFLGFYTTECCLRIFVQRMEFLSHRWNLFDLFIVFSGILGEILNTIMSTSQDVVSLQLLRFMRILRLLRVTRVLTSFPELYVLVSGLATCMRTLMWAAGLILMMLTAWSVIAVEYVNPLMQDIEDSGYYSSCHWCPQAFQSIMQSNLTFFQIMSGDGWSLLTRVIIERHPWTAIIFCSVIFTMVFGLLNLMTAVVVDSAAQARERDIMRWAAKKQEERDLAWKVFAEMCVDLDEDGSGDISMDELIAGLKKNPDLRAYLCAMGVEQKDLGNLFCIMDTDGNGELSHEEFVTQLYRMKTIDATTTSFFMKAYIDEIYKSVHKILEALGTENSSPGVGSSNGIALIESNSRNSRDTFHVVDPAPLPSGTAAPEAVNESCLDTSLDNEDPNRRRSTRSNQSTEANQWTKAHGEGTHLTESSQSCQTVKEHHEDVDVEVKRSNDQPQQQLTTPNINDKMWTPQKQEPTARPGKRDSWSGFDDQPPSLPRATPPIATPKKILKHLSHNE